MEQKLLGPARKWERGGEGFRIAERKGRGKAWGKEEHREGKAAVL